jgi:hypothetical protein
MHMWHHVTNHLIISTDKDSNSENQIKLRVRDTMQLQQTITAILVHFRLSILLQGFILV